MCSIACVEVRPELLAEASVDVLAFCECIKNVADHTSYCGKLCGEIRGLNEMLKRSPLDAFVLLAQILSIRKLASVRDEYGNRHVFARHKNARFVYKDKRGKECVKNIMHVIENMEAVLIGLCSTGLEPYARVDIKCLLVELELLICA